MAAEPERYELHYQDETHVETNPYLGRVWHRRGRQPTVPAAGTNRRLTVFGSVEVVRARAGGGGAPARTRPASAATWRRWMPGTPRPGARSSWCWTTGLPHQQGEPAALAERGGWLDVIWLAPYCPQLNPKEREWRRLKRDARSHLAA